MEEATDLSVRSEPEEFFRLLYPELFRYVAWATGAPPSDVEDIVSESLLHAWRDRRRFRGDSSPVTWAISIARNRVKEFRRKEGLRRRSEEILGAIARMDTEPVPEDLFQEVETKRRVRRTLEEMPAAYGRVLVQRYLEGLTVKDIATQSGESEEAVESRLRRARETFKDCLKRSNADDEP